MIYKYYSRRNEEHPFVMTLINAFGYIKRKKRSEKCRVSCIYYWLFFNIFGSMACALLKFS